ncbi:ABC transporter ATP-binding protein, partial [Streptococcus sp. CL6.22]
EYYRKKFFNRLAEIDRQEQLVLLSSHYKEELVEICDSMVTIHQGKIEEVPL